MEIDRARGFHRTLSPEEIAEMVRTGGWLGNEVCMVFDGETGNALDSFDWIGWKFWRVRKATRRESYDHTCLD